MSPGVHGGPVVKSLRVVPEAALETQEVELWLQGDPLPA